MNTHGVWAIYRFEMARGLRTLWQSLITPVLLTSLNFIIFGGALGSRIQEVGGVDYGSFLVPGLIMSSLLVQSVSNASIGIYFPKFTGTVFELLSAPISAFEMVLGYVGAATTKSVAIGLVILATATAFVDVRVDHPLAMLGFLILTSLAFSLFGFIIGVWAKNFEQLNFVPTLIVTPLTFLGGVFYSIDMLPEPWRTVTLFNPVVYLVSVFRWSFFGTGDVPVAISLAVTLAFLLLCLGIVMVIFRTGWRLKN
ncbi:ABC transporter permease [Sphingomonas aracearum]|uniref:Transport permease protein n=1 Tax=Sphingomonas aracearum TaxID=2283317 RepID=A0A369W3V4_9SPHN|nr:ABC transporter permease [Sphingomonas aracearum]RDE06741.1 sugar ABC transporter permease [Sphingomonas aracearum]